MEENKDSRLVHIKIIATKLLNVSESHWSELMEKEENEAIIKVFLDMPTTVLLLIFLDEDKKLVLSLEMYSSRYKPKMVAYFLKNNPIVSSENFKEEIVFGSICGMPLGQYQTLFEKVLYLQFSSPLNNNRWPEEVANNVILHFQDFQKRLTYHIDFAQGKTTLIIPEKARIIEKLDIDDISSDKVSWELRDAIHSITDMLCEWWIPMIREVLDVTPESILLKVRQGPATEIKFWEDRKKNLEYIQGQLNDPVVEKMLFALEKTKNVHYSIFKNLLQEVVEALAEAKEISKSLSTMSGQLEKLEVAEFDKLKECLPEAMKTVTSAWANSKYYNQIPGRISVLIKKFCFFIIEKVEDCLNPPEMFKANSTEMGSKVKTCIETCKQFLQSYSDCRESYKDDKVYPWEFPDERVFDSFKMFFDRLVKIDEIFDAWAVYCSIPDYKILGIEQAPFKFRLDKLSSDFKECFEVFVRSTYDPLDLKSEAFIEDYKEFSSKVADLDHKLGTTLCQMCLSCTVSEDSFKLMDLVGDLLKRPLVDVEFRKFITPLLRCISCELVTAKANYEHLLLALPSNKQIIYKNLPMTSAELQWSIDFQKKLSFPIDSLQQIEQYYTNIQEVDVILKTYKEMDELVQKFQGQIFTKWQTTLDIVRSHLEKPLFISDEKKLILNFNPQIVDISHGIEHSITTQKADLLPSDAAELRDTLKTMLHAYSLLAYSTKWYSDINNNEMKSHEMELMKNDWEKVCGYLKEGFEVQWSRIDLNKYAEKVYEATKSFHEKIKSAKGNVEEVQNFIETWNESPMIVRKVCDALANIETGTPLETSRQMSNAAETSQKMNKVMEKNLLLFQPDPESEEWKKYVLHLDSVIETALKDSVICSLQYLVENTNRHNKNLVPFYKIKMVLEEDIAFIPPLDDDTDESFYSLFEDAIDKIYFPASHITRLANAEMNYKDEIKRNEEVQSLQRQLLNQIKRGIDSILDEKEKYDNYSDLWIQDIDTVLKDFIEFGPLPEGEEEIQVVPPKEHIPKEEEFTAEITQFEMLQKKIDNAPAEILVESWLLLDTTSFKESFLSLIKNWATAYKEVLLELKVLDKLPKIEDEREQRAEKKCAEKKKKYLYVAY